MRNTAKKDPNPETLQAAFFDSLAADASWQCFSDEQMALLRRFLDLWDIRPGHRILEPGCGTGRLTRLLAEHAGPAGEVAACDISLEMLHSARSQKLPPNVRFIHGAVENMICPQSWFDRIICLHVFPHLLRPKATLRKFAASLKPDGQLWICHLSGRQHVNHRHRRGDPAIRDHLLPPIEELKILLAQAGLAFLSGKDTPSSYHAAATPRKNAVLSLHKNSLQQ